MKVQEVHKKESLHPAALIFAVGLLLLLLPQTLISQTHISGSISASLRWSISGSPYIVSGDLIIAEDAELDIDPGCRLIFRRNASLIVNGRLKARGTQSQMIEIKGESEKTGWWKSIIFSAKNSQNSILEFCKIRHTGSDGGAALIMRGESPPELTGCEFSKNVYNAIQLPSGNIDYNMELPRRPLPYMISGDLIQSAEKNFVISPGVTLKFSKRSNLLIRGRLIAQATCDSPILFTSFADNSDGVDSDAQQSAPQSGDWGGISLESGSGSRMKHVHIRYGGGSSVTQGAMLMITNCSPLIEFCTFSNSKNDGVAVRGNSRPDLGSGHMGSAGRNTFTGFSTGGFALVNRSKNNISAKYCCWGENDVNEINSTIYDNSDRTDFGKIYIMPYLNDCSPQPPDIVELIAPDHMACDIRPPIEFIWNKEHAADYYELQVAEDTSFTRIIKNINNIPDTSIRALDGMYSRTIWWRCRAVNGAGAGEWSQSRKLRTYDTAPPLAPDLIYPMANASNVAPALTFQWSKIENASEYYFRLMNEKLEQIIPDTTTSENMLRIAVLEPECSYWWTVASINSNGRGEWATPRKFTTIKQFTKNQSLPFLKNAAIGVSDLNADGKSDIIAAGESNSGVPETRVYLSNTTGYEIVAYSPGLSDASICVEDFDGDTDADILIAGRDSDGASRFVMFENRYGRLAATDLPPRDITDLSAIDYDSDGDMDAVVLLSRVNNSSVAIYENRADGFTLVETQFPDGPYRNIYSSEINLDGIEDLFITEQNKSVVYINRDKIYDVYKSLSIINSSLSPYDYNKDGKVDILVSDSYPRILLGDSFDEIVSFEEKAVKVEIFDSDSDGDAEIFSVHGKCLKKYQNGEWIIIDTVRNAEYKNVKMLHYGGEMLPGVAAITDDSIYIYRNNIARHNLSKNFEEVRYSFEGDDVLVEWRMDSAAGYTYDCRLLPGDRENVGQPFGAGAGRLGSSLRTKFRNIPAGEYSLVIRAFDMSKNCVAMYRTQLKTKDLQNAVPANWKYQLQTGENTIVLLRSNLGVALDNEYALRSGDALGAFYFDGEKRRCAGYAYFNSSKNTALTIWGDNTQTFDIKDGFAYGDRLRFIKWDASRSAEIPLKAAMDQGYEVYVADTVSVVAGFGSLDSAIIDLPASKWKIAAAPIEPFYPQIDSIFSEKISFMKAGEIFPERPAIYDHMRALRLWSDDSDTIRLTGYSIEKAAIPLEAGSNLAPYLPDKSMSIGDALESLHGNLICAVDWRGRLYLPEFKYDEINALKPGEGYQLFLKMPDTLVYPAVPEQSEIISGEYAPCMSDAPATGKTAVFILAGDVLRSGDMIRFYAGDVLCGCANIIKNKAIATIWGDNPITPAKDGAAEGETISAVLIIDGREVDIKSVTAKSYPDGDVLSPGFIYETDCLKNFEVIQKPNSVVEFASQFNLKIREIPGGAAIELDFQTPGECSIRIFDILGNEHFSHEMYMNSAGKKLVFAKIDIPGIYFLRAYYNRQHSKTGLIIIND